MFRRIARSYREAYTGLPGAVWLLSVVAFINRAGTMVFPFLSLYMTDALGFEVTTAGQVLSVYGMGAIVGGIGGGWLVDRIGSARTQLWSLLLAGVVFMALVPLKSPWLFIPGLALLSVTAESFRPAAMAGITEYSVGTDAARSFGLLRLAVNLGMAIGPALGGLLAAVAYHWLFIADGLTCWFAFVLLWFGMRRMAPPPSGAAEEGSGTGDSAADSTAAEAPADGSPWRDPGFLFLLFLSLVYASLLFQIFSTMPVYLRDVLGMSEGRIGAVLAFNALLIVALEMVLTHELRNVDHLRLIGAGLLLTGLGLGLLAFGSSLAWVCVTVVVWTFGEMLMLPFSNALIARRAGAKNRGRYMGLYTSTWSVAFVIAPLGGTLIYERFGPDILWYTAGAIGILCSLLCLRGEDALGKPEAA